MLENPSLTKEVFERITIHSIEASHSSYPKNIDPQSKSRSLNPRA